MDDCELILDCYNTRLRTVETAKSPCNKEWAHGRKHIFLSEGARQQLERLRDEKRTRCATSVQSWWRGQNTRRKLGLNRKPLNNNVFRNQQSQNRNSNLNTILPSMSNNFRSSRPKPIAIAGTPPPLDVMQTDRCDFKTIQQTCALFGLDLVSHISFLKG